jgi:hypothetical protein
MSIAELLDAKISTHFDCPANFAKNFISPELKMFLD